MKAKPLVFDGTSFAGVTVSGGLAHTNGKGRRWSTKKPLAFWRTFAEIPVLDTYPEPEVAAGFVSRYGDLYGTMPEEPGNLFHWRMLSALLRAAAQAWDDPDEDGISHLTKEQQRLRLARYFLRDEQPLVVKMVNGTTPAAKNLHDFMILSAAFHLEAEIPMRRCLECGHWTDASHAKTRYCSNACLIRASLQRKETA
ncbi:hypothetical protein I6F15_00115 [Bradyrhizobium sp. BRP14]|nr:hypothetical protein [Bradyrhizobium sp. BRP14]